MPMQNTLAMLPMLAITVFSGEMKTLMTLEWQMGGILALVASCVGGLGMSYFSFALRAVISATSFSVIGNVCKVLTILVNLLMWEKHSSKPWTWHGVHAVLSSKYALQRAGLGCLIGPGVLLEHSRQGARRLP